jgi:hypothetical protein
MLHFRHYSDAHSLGQKYVFGFNIYGNHDGRPTIDLIIGKHVFVVFIDRRK